jgi:hypothetical protein
MFQSFGILVSIFLSLFSLAKLRRKKMKGLRLKGKEEDNLLRFSLITQSIIWFYPRAHTLHLRQIFLEELLLFQGLCDPLGNAISSGLNGNHGIDPYCSR